jgi:ferritin-like metal-binding protein YciE
MAYSPHLSHIDFISRQRAIHLAPLKNHQFNRRLIMRNQDLHDLFVVELADLYNSENQIIESFPNLIKLVSLPDLKETLTKNLRETENQAKRLERIISILNLEVSENTSEVLQGLFQQAQTLTQNKPKSPTLDAAIISAAQKLKHYKIASYRTLHNFAKQLSFDNEAINLLQETLHEVEAADKRLTKIAEGSLASGGAHRETAEAGSSSPGKKNRF